MRCKTNIFHPCTESKFVIIPLVGQQDSIRCHMFSTHGMHPVVVISTQLRGSIKLRAIIDHIYPSSTIWVEITQLPSHHHLPIMMSHKLIFQYQPWSPVANQFSAISPSSNDKIKHLKYSSMNHHYSHLPINQPSTDAQVIGVPPKIILYINP